ncbi:trypsin-like peptidase domain-containing protein [Streptomyces sp. NPDC127068]|uniref:trypsin-like peptidase domain-containing protein n=1 Tax=Streptomyces sp. NPDC127068 TaxID=3347127 RepID=UPI003653BD45
MTRHHHRDRPWRVRVDDEQGVPWGAGVLLDGRAVLTAAHVVQDAGAHPGGPATCVRVRSTVCSPEWTRTARVAPGTWVYRNGTRRGDVALLELDEPAECDIRTELWKVPISGGRVRVYGFPDVDAYGVGVDAELAGSGGREGERGLLKRVSEGDPWIEPGYSGAGVMALDGEFAGRVIGIVIADYVNEDAKAAWMLPTETILSYLPGLGTISGGNGITDFGPADLPGPDLDDPLQLALTRELARLCEGDRSGTFLVGTGSATGAGSSWLVRLARTSGPTGRTGTQADPRTRAPSGTVLGFGTVDAAFDARGRSTDDACAYLAGRFGFGTRGGVAALVRDLLHRRPPPCLIVDGVDRAADPARLVTELLAPLALRARSRGLRLVLGFEGAPPDDLAYDVHLDPTPLPAGDRARPATEEQARAAVERLAAAEEQARALQRALGTTFLAPPRLPPGRAPRLAVRLAVARTTHPNAEIAAVEQDADAARAAVTRYVDALREMEGEREDLAVSLDLHRVRAARLVGAEDLRLGELYVAAARALQRVPIDLAAARRRVPRYIGAVDQRIGEGHRSQGG